VTAPAIEEALTGHPAIENAAVVDIPDDTKGQVPVAFITVAGDAGDTTDLEQEATDLVAEDLGSPFRPTAVYVVADLPRTQTGKVPRGVLRDAYLDKALGNISTLDNGAVLEEFPSRE
jgi:acetyl-CoA synthetase